MFTEINVKLMDLENFQGISQIFHSQLLKIVLILSKKLCGA